MLTLLPPQIEFSALPQCTQTVPDNLQPRSMHKLWFSCVPPQNEFEFTAQELQVDKSASKEQELGVE